MKWNSLNTVRLRHNVGTGISGVGASESVSVGTLPRRWDPPQDNDGPDESTREDTIPVPDRNC
jgi:hypothetical protein